MTKMTQGQIRRAVQTGSGFWDVVTPVGWWRATVGWSEAEFRAVLRFCEQQALDGMGASRAAWLGMTDEEYGSWCTSGALPSKRRPGKRRRSR